MDSARAAPRMLLLFTGVFANGGIQRFNQTFLEACSRLGLNCNALSLHDSPASIDAHSGWKNVSVTGFSGGRLRFARAAALALLTARYDALLVGHINFLPLAVGFRRLRPFHRPQTLLCAHGIEVWNGLNAARRHALAHTDRILCVSRYTRQRILEQAPRLMRERLDVFPNAISAMWKTIEPEPCQLLPAKRFILSVTRLERGDRYKGIATVIEALSMLEDETLDYIVIGDGNDVHFLQMLAQRHGVKDRIHFLRGVRDPELIALYRDCEAFVLPSGKEGFGIVFLEAMFFGAPVIAAAEKGAVDVVQNGKTGLTVPFGDAIAIKEAIERLGAEAGLRERLRAMGRAQVVGEGAFTFEAFQRRCGKTLLADQVSAA